MFAMRERVHLLGARDARDLIHREHGRLAGRQPREQLRVLARPDERHQERALSDEVGLVVAVGRFVGRTDLEHQVRGRPDVARRLGEGRPGGLVVFVSERRELTRSALYLHLEAKLDEALRRLGCRCDATFTQPDFTNDSDAHAAARVREVGAGGGSTCARAAPP
jgi:hypothetical protein